MQIRLRALTANLWVAAAMGIFGGSAKAAPPTTAAAPPAVTIDLVDPQTAMGTYFRAQKANDIDTLNKVTVVTDPTKKNYVNDLETYQLWARYLERQAIAKFGKEDGLTVEAHVRSLDDQSDLDLKRALEPSIEYNGDKTAAKVFLRIEKNRPEGLQTDTFQFLDVYFLVKTADGWKVDYLKTFKRDDPDKAEDYKSEMGAYPRMCRELQTLAKKVKAGNYKSADDVKNALNTLWDHVYDEPTDASGRTQAEVQAATQAVPQAAPKKNAK